MRFPWQRETRQDTDYGDALLTAIFRQAQGSTGVVNARVGSVATAAGWWARAFASAKLTPGIVADAFGPALRGYTGRQLILRGEVVFVVDVGDGLTLTPAASWDVTGDADPSTWIYKVTINGPSHSVVLEVPASRILHLMYQRSESQPWRGVGPLEDSAETHNLAMALETRLRQEVGGPVGQAIPIPDGGPTSGLEADVNTMRGEVRLTPSTSNNWQTGPNGGRPATTGPWNARPASPAPSSHASVGWRRSAGGRGCSPRRWRSTQTCEKGSPWTRPHTCTCSACPWPRRSTSTRRSSEPEGRRTGSGTSARVTAACEPPLALGGRRAEGWTDRTGRREGG